MLFDINAHLGPFALRELRHTTAEDLLSFMDRHGIGRALVSSAAAIAYKDCHSGNEQLAREAAGAPRLIPCAVLNPAYAGWEKDLERCAGPLGMRALKLYPAWHNYTLRDPRCDALVAAATDLGLPVIVPVRAVDGRQLSWLFEVPDVSPTDFAALIQRHPQGRFVLTEGIGLAGSPLVTDHANLPANYWIEMSRMSLYLGGDIPRLLETLGPERTLFGTGMPFKYPGPALLKLEKLQASDEAKRLIAGANALNLLGLNPAS